MSLVPGKAFYSYHFLCVGIQFKSDYKSQAANSFSAARLWNNLIRGLRVMDRHNHYPLFPMQVVQQIQENPRPVVVELFVIGVALGAWRKKGCKNRDSSVRIDEHFCL